MKALKLFFILLILSSCSKKEEFVKAKITPSIIDSLETSKEIEKFIGQKDTLYKKFKLKRIQDINCNFCDSIVINLANKVNVKSNFSKADFDNNGLTDILAIGENKTYGDENYNPKIDAEFSKDFNVIVLMNFGQNKMKLYDLIDNRFHTLVPKVEILKSESFLNIYSPRIPDFGKKSGRAESKAKLTFKFDSFIEYNSKPSSLDIEKIEYLTTPCMGECPIFKLEINKDKTAKLLAENYNYTENWQKGKLLSGNYKTKISDKEFNDLFDLINYLDFEKLKNNYEVLWTDDQTGILKITYNNGKIKTIKDYGLQGTYGLKRIHEMIFNLRKNQNWKK